MTFLFLRNSTAPTPSPVVLTCSAPGPGKPGRRGVGFHGDQRAHSGSRFLFSHPICLFAF